jgi:hypothetical protein
MNLVSKLPTDVAALFTAHFLGTSKLLTLSSKRFLPAGVTKSHVTN